VVDGSMNLLAAALVVRTRVHAKAKVVLMLATSGRSKLATCKTGEGMRATKEPRCTNESHLLVPILYTNLRTSQELENGKR